MEYIKEVSIREAVIHVLDNNADEAILNEYQLDLNEETYMFLLKHIQRCLKDENLKYAFFNKERNIIKDLSQEYLNGENNILDISKGLARQMFMLMRAKGNIPSCDLLTVSFSTEYGMFLGIFKMDYIKNYMHNISLVEEKIGIDIVPQHTGLPQSKSKIQKCAFIRTITNGNEYDIMLIDKELGKRSDEEYGLNWFKDNYLGCTVIENERDQTKIFLNAVERWTQYALSENADMQEKTRSEIKRVVSEEEIINIPELATEIFKDKDIQQSFISDITMKCNDQVNVDKDYVEKRLKRVRLQLDKNIDLYISQEAYKDKSKLDITANGDGSINITIKSVINYIEK